MEQQYAFLNYHPFFSQRNCTGLSGKFTGGCEHILAAKPLRAAAGREYPALVYFDHGTTTMMTPTTITTMPTTVTIATAVTRTVARDA